MRSYFFESVRIQFFQCVTVHFHIQLNYPKQLTDQIWNDHSSIHFSCRMRSLGSTINKYFTVHHKSFDLRNTSFYMTIDGKHSELAEDCNTHYRIPFHRNTLSAIGSLLNSTNECFFTAHSLINYHCNICRQSKFIIVHFLIVI